MEVYATKEMRWCGQEPAVTWESFDGRDPSQIIQHFGVVPLSPMSTIVAIMKARLTVSPDQPCLSAERNRTMLYFA